MYVNLAVVHGRWQERFKPGQSSMPLGIYRFATSRDIPTVSVMLSFFDGIVEDFTRALECCDLSRVKRFDRTLGGKTPSVSFIELYTFNDRNAPTLLDIHSGFWQECLLAYGDDLVEQLRIDMPAPNYGQYVQLAGARA